MIRTYAHYMVMGIVLGLCNVVHAGPGQQGQGQQGQGKPGQAAAAPAAAPAVASAPAAPIAAPAGVPALSQAAPIAQPVVQAAQQQGQGQGRGRDDGAKASTPALTSVQAGTQATVQQLFDYINKNNSAKSSNFLVLGSDGKSSFGAANSGFDAGWVKKNSGMSVTLVLDSAREAATAGADKKGPMLYFTATSPMTSQLVNLYLYDPNPPMAIKSAKSR